MTGVYVCVTFTTFITAETAATILIGSLFFVGQVLTETQWRDLSRLTRFARAHVPFRGIYRLTCPVHGVFLWVLLILGLYI